MRRDRRGGGGARRRSRRQFGAGQDPVQRGAVAGERARGVRRRGAGDRGARACRCARPDHRQGAGGRQPFDRRDRRGGGGRGPGPDRRCHRRADHRQGDRDGRRQAADGDQPPRGACADGAAHRGRPVSLLPVPRLRRAHPDRRGAGDRRLHAARHHPGRRDRRGLRQDREAAGAGLSGRPAGGEGSGAGKSFAVCFAAADAGAARAGLSRCRG